MIILEVDTDDPEALRDTLIFAKRAVNRLVAPVVDDLLNLHKLIQACDVVIQKGKEKEE